MSSIMDSSPLNLKELVKTIKTEVENLTEEPQIPFDSIEQQWSSENINSYQPTIVSLGPGHHGNPNLGYMERQKCKILNNIFNRSDRSLISIIEEIAPNLDDMIIAYSNLDLSAYSRNDFLKMMVYDGIFVSEILRNNGFPKRLLKKNISLFSPMVLPNVLKDMLCLENQLPFFVVQTLFEATKTNPEEPSLHNLINNCFFGSLKRQPEAAQYQDVKHLLDCVRKSFLTFNTHFLQIDEPGRQRQSVQPLTNLLATGVKFKVKSDARNFLDVTFKKGVLLIPELNIDELLMSFFKNAVAYEQRAPHSFDNITAYLIFMSFLIEKAEDLDILCARRIIGRYCSTESTLKFFNEIGTGVAFDTRNNYLAPLCIDINNYCSNKLQAACCGFRLANSLQSKCL